MTNGELFILSAPSGTGKTTLVHSLMRGELADLFALHFAVSHTTRAPRKSEVDGKDYHFVDPSVFREMIANHRFLEWAEVHGHCYGTSLDEVLPYVERGVDVLVDIDVQGAERVLALYGPEAGASAPPCPVHSIFIMPPSYADLEQRLRQRNLDGPEQIARRLAVSWTEMQSVERYDYAIVNRDAEVASHVLASIILEKRHRRERMRKQVEQVLRDFRVAHADD